MTPTATLVEDPVAPASEAPAPQSFRVYRLRPIMRQGTAAGIPETWTRYASIDDARRAAKVMYHDDRVLRVFATTDDAPPRFVEWIER